MGQPEEGQGQGDGQGQDHGHTHVPVQDNVGNLEGQIKMATILMICFIAEHNLPFLISEHLTELCKVMFPDSAIAQDIHMKRTKCTEYTKRIAATVQEELAQKLRKNPFSVIIDESTDTSKTKCMCVIVKFYDQDDGFM